MSGEHLISNSILQEKVTVQGFSWCKEAPKTIPAATFKSKTLCEKHNRELSLADCEIKHFIDSFKSFFENSMAFDRRRQRFPSLPIRFSINGRQLERWFCKTVLNVAYLNSSDAIIQVDEVLPYLFRGKAFERPYGLSFAVRTGDTIRSQESGLQIEPLFHEEQGKQRLLVGCLVILRSFHFILLLPTRMNPIVDNTLPLRENKKDWAGMQLNWHNREITEYKSSKTLKVLFQVVSLQWE